MNVTYAPRVSAGMPLPLLLDKARRWGRGGLERRQLAALDGLALLLPHHSAAGYATPNQIGDAMGYTGRWMRVSLAELEALGVLEWRRGGVVAGRATPGFFRVVKARLCEMILAGVSAYSDIVRARSSATAARIAGLRHVVRRRRHNSTVEVAVHLSPFGEVTAQAKGPVVTDEGPVATPETARRYVAEIRRSLSVMKAGSCPAE